jgi:hypothetical protein
MLASRRGICVMKSELKSASGSKSDCPPRRFGHFSAILFYFQHVQSNLYGFFLVSYRSDYYSNSSVPTSVGYETQAFNNLQLLSM